MNLADVLAKHQWRGEILGCRCGWNWPEERTYFCGEEDRILRAHLEHQAEAIAAAGLAVIRKGIADGLIKSFRYVEARGSLYDAATHRWIDLLAEQVSS